MSYVRYITHPEVVIDPAIPVGRWGLSKVGVSRAKAMLAQPWVGRIGKVVCSDETKAIETAEILGEHLGLDIEVRADTAENDRTATGFLPPAEFARVADTFFAEPERSVRGWERAIDAQARIAGALADLLYSDTAREVAVVGHGAVGTLWYCHLAGQAIDGRHDQTGAGHYFALDLEAQQVLHHWRPKDQIRPHVRNCWEFSTPDV